MTRRQRFMLGVERAGWRQVLLVDEHGCLLNTEPVCMIPIRSHAWFAEWLETQEPACTFIPLLHHENKTDG